MQIYTNSTKVDTYINDKSCIKMDFYGINLSDKGKLAEKQGRKVTGLPLHMDAIRIAGLPDYVFWEGKWGWLKICGMQNLWTRSGKN